MSVLSVGTSQQYRAITAAVAATRRAVAYRARLSCPHTGGDALADEQRFQLGHGADDGEHCSAHWAVGVDLILDADEPNSEVVEFLKRREQVTRAAS